MNIYPVAFSLASGDQIPYNIPIRGKIVGISTTFIGAVANSQYVQFNVTVGGTSLMDGFINCAIWNQLVVPLWVPNANSVIDVDDIATVTAQNSYSGTLTFTITLLTAGGQ